MFDIVEALLSVQIPPESSPTNKSNKSKAGVVATSLSQKT